MDFKPLLLSLCFAVPLARAQYQPNLLTVAPAVEVVLGPADVHAGLLLEYSRYLESGFDFYARVPVLLTHTPAGADTPSGSGWVVSTGLSLGVRYLFLEEQVRPWLGLHAASTLLGTTPSLSWYVGPGTSAGLDVVLSESFVVGARVTWDVFIVLNGPWRQQLQGALTLSVLW